MRRITFGAVTVVVALTLVACGSGSGKEAASTGDHNAADVTFAQKMIPHHEQAVEMADLAEARAAYSQVKALAAQITAAQGPEIKQMTGWLRAWGEPTAQPTAGGGHGSTGGGHGVAGMMGSEEVAKLVGLSGKKFDRQFLTMMTAHHKGAIEMARTEQADGRYPPAKKLAANVIKSQSEEVAFMAELLKQP